MKLFIVSVALLLSITACAQSPKTNGKMNKETPRNFEISKSEAEWQKELTPEQFRVMRQKGTERAFSGAFVDNHAKGVYKCASCGEPLFNSETKFESGTGWPSFYKPVTKQAVAEETDTQYGMVRTEVLCGKCGGHLGHVFDDGPKPTGLRYCMNSVSLKFQPAKP
jgi:peptide-methionine (R)-S-oxide reductase